MNITSTNISQFGTKMHLTLSKNAENDITIAMATQPSRINSYINTVYELLPYCDRFCICFNGFDKIPDNCPKSSKIIAICANNKNGIKDLGCNNKMYWLGDFPGYYLTVDDDIHYPSNYVSETIKKIKYYGDDTICSYHGHIYSPKNGQIDFFNNRKVFCFYVKRNADIFCHRAGMGVAICNPQKIGLNKLIYLNKPKNFGDDEITAIWAQTHNIPIICLSTTNVSIISDDSVALTTGLCTNKASFIARGRYLESFKKWKLNTKQIKLLTDINNDDVFFRIIIPTYNVENFIERCINSIISQTFTNYKIIIIDDCSTDKTQEKIKFLQKKYPDKINYQFLKNKKYGGGARNIGLTYYTNAKYTLFIDSDDYFYNNNVFKNIYNKIQQNNFPDLVKCSFVTIKNKQLFKSCIIPNKYENVIKLHSPPTSCVKTDIIPSFIENRIRFNDVIWSLRVYDKIKTFYVIQEPCFCYTLDENIESCQHAKLDDKRVAAIYYLIGDLINENFNKKEIREQKQLIINSKLTELKSKNFYDTFYSNKISL